MTEKNMKNISVRTMKDLTEKFQVIIRFKGLKPVTKTFNCLEDAEEFVETTKPKLKQQAKKTKCNIKMEQKGNPTYAEFMQEDLAQILNDFIESDRAITRHKKNYPTIMKYVGRVSVGQIKTSWVNAYITKLRTKTTLRKTTFSYETIASHMGVMALAIRWRAEQLDLAPPQLPFSKKLFPKNWENKRDRRLKKIEERRIMDTMRGFTKKSKYHWRLLVRLALETGARMQEMLMAEWDEFDIDRRLWIIPADHIKTDTERAVPLSRAATRIMRLLRLLSSPKSNRPFHRLGFTDSVSTSFHRLMLDIGIKNYRFHDLRHEAISRMVLHKRKLSVFEIMKIVGHSSPEMLARYANLRGDEMVARMD